MKKLEKFSSKALSRADLAKIKGGTDDCPALSIACHPNCGHFHTDYGTFVACLHGHACSPLQGWGDICGNYNSV